MMLAFPAFLCIFFAAVRVLAKSDDVLISGAPHRVVHLTLERSSGSCRPIALDVTATHKRVGEGKESALLEVKQAEWGIEGKMHKDIVTVWAIDYQAAWEAAQQECMSAFGGSPDFAGEQQIVFPVPTSTTSSPRAPRLDVRPLQTSGPSENRVNLLFLSDGYTVSEENKFFADAQTLVDAVGVREEEAFGSVKGLVNWWAGFVPSRESGVGTSGMPKDTIFGLYRPGTELRGLYYAYPEVARAACRSMGRQCDYPILLGNSPYYGGLGGEFTTITSSFVNGPLVLRHELGHSIIDVGEEYDGGGYFGVNAAPSFVNLSWAHWLSVPERIRAELNALPLLDYAWTMLNSTTPWSTTFTTTGLFPRALLRFSLSGVPRVSDLIVRLDGHSLPWLPKPDIGMDRWFYDIPNIGGPSGLAAGDHLLEFALTYVGQEGEAQLCNVELFEYGNEDEFNTSEGFIGAFPTYSDEPPYDLIGKPKHWNVTSYRPTNEGCLMRQVTTSNFCSVCKEELWMRLLARVDLIDDVIVTCTPKLARRISLEVAPVPGLEIKWSKDGEYVPEFEGMRTVELSKGHSLGVWDVNVTLRTPEIRRDEHGYTEATRRVVITTPCPLDRR